MSDGGGRILDCTGLLCPQPIIDLAAEIDGLSEGGEIEVLSDDVAFPLDLRAWCAGTGHELLDLETAGRLHRARIKKLAR